MSDPIPSGDSGLPESLPDPRVARDRILRALGKGSSHPAFAVHRLRWARWLTRAPVWIVLGAFAWLLFRPLVARGISSLSPLDVAQALLGTLRLLVAAPAWVLLALACSIAASLTVAFTIRASLVRGETAAEPTSSAGELSLVGTMLALTLVAAAGLGWFLASPGISLAARMWTAAGLFLPASLLMAWFDLTALRTGEATSARVWAILRWAFFSVVTLAGVVMISPLAIEASDAFFRKLAGLAASPRLGPLSLVVQSIISDRLQPAVGHLVAVGTAILVTLHLSSRAKRMARNAAEEAERLTAALRGESGPEEPPPEPPRRGCLGRLFGASAPDTDEETATAEGPPPPDAAFVEAMERDAARLGLAFERTWEPWKPIDPADPRFSAPAEDESLAWLFNGRVPSVDQRMLLEAFQYRWSEHVRAIQDARYGADRESHADLLVEAERGSQESDAIAACAIFAAVARGQRVLLLVPDEDSREALVVSMNRRLEGFGLGFLYRVEAITPESVARWCPPAGEPEAPVPGVPPDLCVATPDDYERVFFSGAFAAERLLAVQRCLEVVVFERIDRVDASGRFRRHLPFLLDKHRLLLRNDNRAMQLVVSTRPIGPRGTLDPRTGELRPPPTVARRMLARRLFGGDGGLAGRSDPDEPPERSATAHLVYLRSRATGTPATFRLETELTRADATRRWFVKWLLDRGEEGVTILALDRRESPAALRDRFAGARRMPRCLSLEQALGDATLLGTSDWVVLSTTPNADEERKVREALGAHPRCRVVTVGPVAATDDRRESEPKPILPVFPVAESPALFVAHLRSAVPLLRPDLPTRREDFARFGLSWDEDRWRSYAAALEPRLLQENWAIELDGTLADIVRADGLPWPAAFVRHRPGLRAQPVDLGAPVPASLCLVPIGNALQAGSADHLIDRRRFATWMTSRGLELGRSDLAYFDPIQFRSSRQVFRAIDLRQTPEGIVVEAEPLSHDGGNFVVPVRSTRIDLPSGMAIEGPRNVRAVHAQLFRMRETDAPCRVLERIVALETLDGGAGETDEVRRRAILPIEFEVHAGVTVLTVGAALPTAKADETLRARYEGTWEVREDSERDQGRPREHWPELTRAFGYALSQVAPTLGGFMQAYGFHPPRGTAGATVVVVEPAGTQGTALEALSILLDDRVLHERLVEAFARAIEEPRLRAPHAPLPRSERAAPDAAASREGLRQVLELLRATSGDAGRIGVPDEIHGVIRHESLAPPAAPSPRTWLEPPVGAHLWVDHHSGIERSFGVAIDLPSEAVDRARREFGWDPAANAEDADLLRRGCVRIVQRVGGSTVLAPDYARMVEESVPHLQPIAGTLRRLARDSGAADARGTVAFLASFVQSFRYEAGREGYHDDGRWRFGIQMPLVTLADRSGDCDSLALLLVALLRAGSLGRGGLVVVEEGDGGHAFAGVEMPRARDDHFVTAPGVELVLVECTSPWPIGRIEASYRNRYATVERT